MPKTVRYNNLWCYVSVSWPCPIIYGVGLHGETFPQLELYHFDAVILMFNVSVQIAMA